MLQRSVNMSESTIHTAIKKCQSRLGIAQSELIGSSLSLQTLHQAQLNPAVDDAAVDDAAEDFCFEQYSDNVTVNAVSYTCTCITAGGWLLGNGDADVNACGTLCSFLIKAGKGTVQPRYSTTYRLGI